jgi:hypothetical protein
VVEDKARLTLFDQSLLQLAPLTKGEITAAWSLQITVLFDGRRCRRTAQAMLGSTRRRLGVRRTRGSGRGACTDEARGRRQQNGAHHAWIIPGNSLGPQTRTGSLSHPQG